MITKSATDVAESVVYLTYPVIAFPSCKGHSPFLYFKSFLYSSQVVSVLLNNVHLKYYWPRKLESEKTVVDLFK